MEHNYNSIPLPPFSMLEIVKKKTDDFIAGVLRPRQFHLSSDDLINEFLWTLTNREHRLQALCIVINRCIEELNTHKNGNIKLQKFPCNREGCSYEKDSEETLYIFYGKLEEYDVNPFLDVFSLDEIIANNSKLDDIKDVLDRLLIGQEIIFDEVDKIAIEQAKQRIEDAKGLQVLGKQKWQTFIAGIGIQLATQGAISRVWQDQLSPHFESLVMFAYKLLQSPS